MKEYAAILHAAGASKEETAAIRRCSVGTATLTNAPNVLVIWHEGCMQAQIPGHQWLLSHRAVWL